MEALTGRGALEYVQTLDDSAREVAGTLNVSVEKLPERKREVFILCDVEQLEREEVAEILGISTAMVRSRLFYARQAFAKHLERERSRR